MPHYYPLPERQPGLAPASTSLSLNGRAQPLPECRGSVIGLGTTQQPVAQGEGPWAVTVIGMAPAGASPYLHVDQLVFVPWAHLQ